MPAAFGSLVINSYQTKKLCSPDIIVGWNASFIRSSQSPVTSYRVNIYDTTCTTLRKFVTRTLTLAEQGAPPSSYSIRDDVDVSYVLQNNVDYCVTVQGTSGPQDHCLDRSQLCDPAMPQCTLENGTTARLVAAVKKLITGASWNITEFDSPGTYSIRARPTPGRACRR